LLNLAYFYFTLFDDQFTLVDYNRGVRQIQGDPNVLQKLAVSRVTIQKTGFLYIYSSNESGDDVLFDNLVVTHNTGPVVEETHYYPFGLTMEGISSHALKGLNYPENRFKYNGIEKIGDLGLEDYDAKFRELDPQIGRWWQIDPKIESMEMWSPYASNYDNPIRFNDVLGDEPDQRGAPIPGPKKTQSRHNGSLK
jgi:RHS repeat-associated protein